MREARSSGGRAARNPVVAIQCAALYDADDTEGEDAPKTRKRRLLAERYGLPENEVKHYVQLGGDLISGVGEINL